MTIYYVRSDADAGGDGTTDAVSSGDGTHAWNSIGQFRAKAYSSGDIVNIRAGDTFDDANFILQNITGSINGLTFQGADFGGKTIAVDGKPWIDNDSLSSNPNFYSYDLSNLTLKDLNMSGLGTTTSKTFTLKLGDISGLVLDGIYLQGDYGTPIANKVGQNGIYIENTCTGTIEVKNCEIFNIGPTDATGTLDMFSNTTDCVGLVIYGVQNATVYIHDNVIHDTQTDNMLLYMGLSSYNSMVYVYDNNFYDAGEDNIDVKGYDNVEIYNNNFYRSAGFNGYIPGGSPVSCIMVHESGSQTTTHQNIKIHDNNFYDFPQPDTQTTYMIRLGSGSSEPYNNIEVYRNTFDNTHICLSVGVNITNWYFTNNLILNPLSLGVSVNASAAGDRYITNNTFIRGSATSGVSAIYMEYSNQDVIKNNVVEWGGSGAMCLTVTTSGTEPIVDHNIWNNADDTNKVSWLGTYYGESNWSTWTASHAGDSYADPTLLATGRLGTGSPAFGAGVIVAGVNDVGKLDMWGNCNNDSPNMGADLGSDQNATSIDTGFAFNEASYTVRVS